MHFMPISAIKKGESQCGEHWIPLKLHAHRLPSGLTGSNGLLKIINNIVNGFGPYGEPD